MNNENFDTQFEKGKQFYNNGEYQKALDIFNEIYETTKSDDYLNDIGACYMRLGLYDKANQVRNDGFGTGLITAKGVIAMPKDSQLDPKPIRKEKSR